MADVPVNTAAQAGNWKATPRSLVMVTADVGYQFLVDANTDLIYQKTTDGGGTWGSNVIVRTGTINCFDIWYDRWTPGNTGTLIHIVYQDSTATDILYRNLDTAASDVLNPTVASSAAGTVVFNGASFTTILGTWDQRSISITRARGGNLYIISNPDSNVEHGVYRSTDVGATWSPRTFSFINGAIYVLLPANTSDPQDVCALRIQTASSTFPACTVIIDSSGSLGTTQIGSFPMTTSTTYLQFSASIRHSDNHVIFAQWSEVDTATADLRVWDLDSSSTASNGTTVVQKTNVITDTSEYAQCCVHIDQNTGDIYVAYLGGGTWATSANAYYKKSTDGGTSWGTQTQLNTTTKDYRAIWCDLGGTTTRFLPSFQDDDLDDIFVNKDNSVVIAPAAPTTSFLFPSVSPAMRALMAR